MVKSAIERKHLAIAMLDIDNFKKLNDTKGHVYGDYVLKEVAKSLSLTLSGHGCVGRYGGEEFLVVLPQKSREETEQLLNNCRKAVIGNEFLKNEWVTVSGGFTLFDHHDSLEEFIKEADNYLYQAKNSGKNKIVGP